MKVGAEQVSSFSSSASAPTTVRWVTVRLRATTFFRLAAFFATFKIMPLHLREPLCSDIGYGHDDGHVDDVDYNDDDDDLQHGPLCDG